MGERTLVPAQGITITVTEIGRGKVILSIDAPRDIRFYREEIWKDMLERQETEG